MGEVTREELAAMTDQELLAYEREHHGDPYMTLLRAKGMQRVALQFWDVGAARKKADREARGGGAASPASEARRGASPLRLPACRAGQQCVSPPNCRPGPQSSRSGQCFPEAEQGGHRPATRALMLLLPLVGTCVTNSRTGTSGSSATSSSASATMPHESKAGPCLA